MREPEDEEASSGVLRPPVGASEPASPAAARGPIPPTEEPAAEELEEEEDDLLWSLPEAETSWLPSAAPQSPLANLNRSAPAGSQWLDEPAQANLTLASDVPEAETVWCSTSTPEPASAALPEDPQLETRLSHEPPATDVQTATPLEPDPGQTIRLDRPPHSVERSPAAPEGTHAPARPEPAPREPEAIDQHDDQTIRLPSKSRQSARAIPLATAPKAPPPATVVPSITRSVVDAHPEASSVTLFGTAAPDCTIEISDWTVSVGTTQAGPDGLWTQTLLSIAEGTHTYKATAIDPDGNTLGSSAPYPVTIEAAAAPKQAQEPGPAGRFRARRALLALAGGLVALAALGAVAFLTLKHNSKSTTLPPTPIVVRPKVAASNPSPHATATVGARPTAASSTRGATKSPPPPARLWTFPALAPTTDQVILTVSNANNTAVDVDIRTGRGVRHITIPQAGGVELQLSPHDEASALTMTASAPILPTRLVIHNHSVRVTEGTPGAGQGH